MLANNNKSSGCLEIYLFGVLKKKILVQWAKIKHVIFI